VYQGVYPSPAAYVDETQAVTPTGNVHPLARPEFDLGQVSAETRMDRIAASA